MSVIEDIICDKLQCVSIYIPDSKPLGAVLNHLDEEIAKQSDNIVKEIIRSIEHLVNVYKQDGVSVIIFMNENIVGIFADRPVKKYGFYIDTKFFIQDDIGITNGVDANGEESKD